MKNFSLLKGTTLLFLVVMAWPALAQTPASPLHFLEQFAVQQYENGNTLQAAREFERILSIDPSNQTASTYLTKIKNTPSTVKPQVKDPVGLAARDIQQLKKEIELQQHDTQILEELVRNLEAENDNLYMLLDQRSREVMAVREKLHGTPYGQDYAELMGGFHATRVPQQTFIAHDPATLDKTPVSVVLTTPEIDALAASIAGQNKELARLRRNANTNPEKSEAITATLDATRSMLVDKTLALIEKKNAFFSLKEKLTDVNISMKTADAAYTQARTRLEEHIQAPASTAQSATVVDRKTFTKLVEDYAARLKELDDVKARVMTRDAELAALKAKALTPAVQAVPQAVPPVIKVVEKTVPDTEAMNKLLKDYAARAKELDDVKTRAQAREAEFTAFKSGIAAQTAKIAGIDRLLAEKDKQIAALKADLADAQAQVATQKNIVQKQEFELNTARQGLAGIDASLAGIETRLARTEDAIVRLKNQPPAVASITAPTMTATEPDDRDALIIDLQAELKAQKAHTPAYEEILWEVNSLKTELTRKNTSLDEQRTLIATLQARVDALARERRDMQRLLTEKALALSELRDKLTATETKLVQRDLILNAKEETILKLEERTVWQENTRKPAAAVTAENPNSLRILREDAQRLHQALNAKDTTIVDMNLVLLRKDEEIARLKAAIAQVEAINKDATIEEKKALLLNITELTARLAEEEQLKTLKEKESAEALKTARTIRQEMQTQELDIKEKDIQVLRLQQSLKEKNLALKQAEEEVRALEEKLLALEYKQQAIRAVTEDRDFSVKQLSQELDLAKKALAATGKDKTLLSNKTKELAAALAEAQNKLKESELAAEDLKKQADGLRADLKVAQKLIDTREREAARVKELTEKLDARDREILELKHKLNAAKLSVLKP